MVGGVDGLEVFLHLDEPEWMPEQSYVCVRCCSIS